jgi:hypothetical protein
VDTLLQFMSYDRLRVELVSRTVVRQRAEAWNSVAQSESVLVKQFGRSRERICRQAEESSLRHVSGSKFIGQTQRPC